MHNDYSAILNHWELQFRKAHNDIEISGSPERTDFRVVLEDAGGRLLVLEQIPKNIYHHKLAIIQTLNFLSAKGMEYAQPYLPNRNDDYIIEHQGYLFQLVPFVKGEMLNRPAYVFEKWRAKPLADFLVQLKEKSTDMPFFNSAKPFSILAYIVDFMKRFQAHNPELVDKILPVYDHLQKDFFKKHDRLPVAFCHGDYHPLNIIWGKQGINAVIDWEFLGFKPELYDVANLIGCLGMEEPESLSGSLVVGLITKLRQRRFANEESWKTLIDFIVAVRFAWMAEWLRKKDTEMIELEEVYMKLLIKNREALQEVWSTAA